MLQVVLNYFMMAVTLIVMAVPEGLPMAVTLALALNMRRMLKFNNLVRKLHASETMGAVTVICTDKTGTLTQNRMTVHDIQLIEGDHLVKAEEASAATKARFSEAVAANTTAELDENNAPIGNPTEGALLMWLQQQGKDYQQQRASQPVDSQIPFSTEKKYMATTVVLDDKKRTYIKGAPEILSASGHAHTGLCLARRRLQRRGRIHVPRHRRHQRSRTRRRSLGRIHLSWRRHQDQGCHRRHFSHSRRDSPADRHLA